jgi:hypothetical protein
VRLGDTEEWTILNQDTQYHDFHIHQTGFLVTEINRRPARLIDPYDGLRDTFSVPPTVNGRAGEMKAIIPFTDPVIVGRFVFHCHVVKHEDKGMDDVDRRQPWSSSDESAESGNGRRRRRGSRENAGGRHHCTANASEQVADKRRSGEYRSGCNLTYGHRIEELRLRVFGRHARGQDESKSRSDSV